MGCSPEGPIGLLEGPPSSKTIFFNTDTEGKGGGGGGGGGGGRGEDMKGPTFY